MPKAPFSKWRSSTLRNNTWFNKLGLFWLALLLITASVLASAWLQQRIHVETDIFKLLPKGEYSAQVQQANQQVSSLINQKLFVVLEAPTASTLQQATDQLLAETKQSALWQPPQPLLDSEALGKTLYQHRAYLLSQQDQQILSDAAQTGDYAALNEQALSQLLSPGVPISAELLKQDPLLFFPRFLLERANSLNGDQATLEQGWPTLQRDNQYYRLVILNLAKSPFNIDYQDQTSAWLEQVKQHIQQKTQVKTYLTGTLMFASAGTQSAHQEVSTIGVGSTLGLIFLVWFGFRSLRPLATEFAAVSSGCLMALAVTHVLFGEVHLMTLVFGASLIGVSVDFSFYYLSTQAAKRNMSGATVMREMLPSLLMGLLTTIAAYLCLMLTPFPGLKQIAVFSMTGLTAAWITSVLLLPKLPPLDTTRSLKTLKFLAKARHFSLANFRFRIALIVVVLLFGGYGLSQIKADDQVQSLQSKNADVVQQDAKIKQLFHQRQSSQYFVVYGDNAEQVAQREQTLIAQLQLLQQQGKIDGYQALGDWLPSVQQQQHSVQQQQQIPASLLTAYAEYTGLNRADLTTWQADLSQQSLLSIHDLKEHPLYSLYLSEQQRVVLLGTVSDLGGLHKIKVAGVEFVDPVSDLSGLFADYRVQAQYMIVAGLLLLSVILMLVYGWRNVMNVMLPVSLALLSTFAVQAFFAVPLNLFGVMAAFLILGIGVDYAIFYQQDQAGAASVSSAMFLCMLATILGFGLMSLSQTQAIHAFGLTVLLGVIFSFIYATLLTKSNAAEVAV
jgi:predicted exporter